jgi:hypothetical protein
MREAGMNAPMAFDGSARLTATARVLAFVALLALGSLMAWDAHAQWFPARAHDVLGSIPLAVIGLAYLAHQAARPSSVRDWTRSGILVAAFFAWAVNQLWPAAPHATHWNDAAIALFVVDVLLTMGQQRVDTASFPP